MRKVLMGFIAKGVKSMQMERHLTGNLGVGAGEWVLDWDYKSFLELPGVEGREGRMNGQSRKGF